LLLGVFGRAMRQLAIGLGLGSGLDRDILSSGYRAGAGRGAALLERWRSS
jgi:hypothetical protein